MHQTVLMLVQQSISESFCPAVPQTHSLNVCVFGFILHLLNRWQRSTPQSRKQRSSFQSSSASLALVYIPCTLLVVIVFGCTVEQLPPSQQLQYYNTLYRWRLSTVSQINFLLDKLSSIQQVYTLRNTGPHARTFLHSNDNGAPERFRKY